MDEYICETATAHSEDRLLPASRLERMIGKPAPDWAVEDLVNVVAGQGIRLVSLIHVGGDGRLKTLDFVPRDPDHLRDVLVAGERADGSSLFGSMGIPAGASDIVVRPRVHRAFLHPFSSVPTLGVLCGHLGRDGEPLPESPDTMLRRAAARVEAETGVALHGHAEVEFYLGRAPQQEDIYGIAERGYHAASPFVFGEAMRRRAMVTLSEIGVPIKYAHSEVGYIKADEMSDLMWEQHEIELALQPLPDAAESNMLTAWVLRNLAHGSGMRLSFDPIIREGHAGNGLHYHMSLVRGGEHLPMVDGEDGLTTEAKWLVGGLATLGGALMAFGNRKVSSFVRLAQGKEAPNAITWGRSNRKALIRVPIMVTGPSGRAVSPPTVELRLPDGSADPHVLLAGIAQAFCVGHALEGLDALVDRTRAERSRDDPEAALPVPRSLPEVAAHVRRTRALLEAGGVFPTHSIDRLIDALRSGSLEG
jgi:glutamine synthetase